MVGQIISYSVEKQLVKINFKDGYGEVKIINSKILNFFSPLMREERISKAVEDEKAIWAKFEVDFKDGIIVIKTESILARIYKDFKVDIYDLNGNELCIDYRGERKPFERLGDSTFLEAEGHHVEKDSEPHKIQVVKKMFGNEYFYGLGDKTGHLNNRGYGYEMWNTDDPSPHVESHKSLYKSIPFFITISEEKAFGIFFDNTFRSFFDMGKENADYYYFGAEDGNLDYYFIAGPEVKSVIEGYTYLTGRTPIPQIWTLGYQQSRWGYTPKTMIIDIANKFREKDIPCDVIHFDIDYMDGYRIFTWDKDKFAEPEKLLTELSSKGFKAVTIIDPGVKKDKGYKVFDEGFENRYFATDKDGIPYVNEVWPGEALYPDFMNSQVRKWWGNNHKVLTDIGVAGIWNDMNEPASFKGPLPDDIMFNHDGIKMNHKEVHNIYGHLMSKSTFMGLEEHTAKRPFVITRACYAGIQKYSTVWTGDNQSFWEHLRMSIPMLLNLGLSGVSFCGTDVGGFGYDCTPELLSRWVQVGCFTPLFRNHSALLTRAQEPWAFDESTEAINRKYIKLRYKLIPYLYDVFWQGEKDGLPVMRPLMLNYQNDENTYEINDEFMVGDNIIVAPILNQGQKARIVYLPEGKWNDFWSGEIIDGNRYIVREAPLDLCPIYIKKGSIIPNYPEQNYIGEKQIKELILKVYPGNGEYLTYEDDKESFKYRAGEFNVYGFKCIEEGNKLAISTTKLQAGYNADQQYTAFSFEVPNKYSNVVLNGKKITFEKNENNEIKFSVPTGNNIIELY